MASGLCSSRRPRFQNSRTAARGLFNACEKLDAGIAKAALECDADVEAIIHSHDPLLVVARALKRSGPACNGPASALVGLLSEHEVDLDRTRPPSAPAPSRLVGATDDFLRRALLTVRANAQAGELEWLW